jgi:membrane protease YdiL (CAAX protease family)
MAERARSFLASIFVGPHGLRAGWRFLLFAAGIELGALYIEDPLGGIIARHFAINPHELSAPALLIAKFVFCLSVFLVTGIAALAERRRIDSYGLPIDQAFGKFFWKGMIAGLLVVFFAAGAMISSGAMVVHSLALHGSDLAGLALLWFVGNILVGVSEEYTFRGYAMQSLWRGAGFWPAALITTAIFAGDHLEKPGENAMDIGMIFFLGPLSERSQDRFALVGGGLACRIRFRTIFSYRDAQRRADTRRLPVRCDFPRSGVAERRRTGNRSEHLYGARGDSDLDLRDLVLARSISRGGFLR